MDDTPQPWWHLNRRLLPVKTLYFMFLAGTGCLLPFIPIYMKQLGLTASEASIIYGTMPFVSFIVRLAIGALADKIKRHKLVLMICCLLTGIFYVSLLLVSSKRVTTSLLETNIYCNSEDSYIHDCDHTRCPFSFTHYANRTEQENITSITCHADCQFATPGAYSSRVCFKSGPTPDGSSQHCEDFTISSVSDTHLTFGMPQSSLVMRHEIISDRLTINSSRCIDHRNYDLKNLTYNEKSHWRMTCDAERILICKLECDSLIDNGPNLIGCHDDIPVYHKIFWIFFFVFLLSNMAFSPVLSLCDAIAYDILGEDRKYWGQQRLWGSIGYAILAIGSTMIMDAISEGDNTSVDYSYSFYIFGAFMIGAAVMAVMQKISQNITCSKMWENIGHLLSDVQILTFVIVVLFFGIYNGVVEGFLFWYLTDLQKKSGNGESEQIIFGVAIILNCAMEVPILFASGRIIKKLGHAVCLYTVFIAYCIRFIVYSVIDNAWHALFVEPLHGITFGLMWATVSSYASIIAPSGMSATIQGLVGGVHFGCGKGIGSLMTGFLFDRVGEVWTFRIYGISAAVLLLIYVVLHVVWFRHQTKEGEPPTKGDHTKHTDDEEEDEASSPDEHLLGNNVDHITMTTDDHKTEKTTV